MIHEIEVNMYYQGHMERVRMDVCELEKMKVILGMPWLVAHNLEINWETEEVIMTRCPPHMQTGIRKESNKEEADHSGG